MSGTSDNGDISSYSGALNLPGMGGDDNGFESTGVSQELPPLSDYGQRFVQNLPEEERAVGEKWVRQWDDGVSKLRSKYDEQLASYSQLGDIKDLQAGVQLFRMLTGSPDQQQEIADYLADNGITPKQFAAAMKAADKAEAKEADPYADRFDKLERATVNLAQKHDQFYQETQQQRALREYNELLDNAEKQYGNFDRKYVSYLLSTDQAKTLEEAVKMNHQLQPPQRRATAPNLLGGSGSAPHHGGKKPDFANMSEKQVGDYLVARFSQTE